MIDGATLSPGTLLETDFCVIGSGAGGAVAAWHLAQSGHQVIVVEEGSHYRAADFSDNGMDMVGRLYRDAGTVATTSLPFIQIPHGRCVGGTTVVNCGTSFRLPAKYYGHHEGFPNAGELDAAFCEIERLLQIRPSDPAVSGRHNLLLKAGADKLGYRGGFIPRNAPSCVGSGNCNIGCPNGAKLSMEASFVPWAVKQGAEVVFNLRADRLEPRRGGVTVHCQAGEGRSVRIAARDVLVAAGALHTPGLLRRSRLRGLSSHAGQNLTIHPTSGMSGEFAEPVELWKGIPQAYYVDEFADDGLFFEGVGMTADLAALSLPMHGGEHADFMARLPHMASIGLMVSDEPVGSVRSTFGALQISYAITEEVLARMKRAFVECARMMFAAGAERAYLAIAGLPAIESERELDELDLRAVRPHQVHWNAFHPLGTCRIGASSRDGVVDASGRVYGQDHVFVCDGSIFPASTQVNPQLSIMAMSLRIARQFTS
jgi:choline dehydrogenase-like flavoprotein